MEPVSIFTVPSLRKRLSARTSLKRYVRNSLGLKAPRGWGWLTNPRKAAYNRVYNRTTRGCLVLAAAMAIGLSSLGLLLDAARSRGAAVLLVTHSVRAAEAADRTLVLGRSGLRNPHAG
jgi:hypothetical protein